jgi:deoxyribose-phosphate aldolase
VDPLAPVDPFTLELTLLRAGTTAEDVARLCDEAVELSVRAVCVTGLHVAHAARRLEGSGLSVVAVVGFPLGASLAAVKALEAARAVEQGAAEIDMVADLGGLLSGDDAAVRADVAAVVRAAGGRPVKVILETGLLDVAGKERGCRCARDGGAAFVKTCTGFGPGSATVDDVRLLRAAAAPLAVKASGGIRTAEQARALLAAGATRLGTSSARAILA